MELNFRLEFTTETLSDERIDKWDKLKNTLQDNPGKIYEKWIRKTHYFVCTGGISSNDKQILWIDRGHTRPDTMRFRVVGDWKTSELKYLVRIFSRIVNKYIGVHCCDGYIRINC